MQKKIIAVFMAVLLAVSACCVNVFAIEFDGTTKTNEELWKKWYIVFDDFLNDPVSKADDMVKANEALTVGLARNGQTAIGNTSADIGYFMGSLTEEICKTGRISDETVTKFRNIFSEQGYQIDNDAFEKWYNERYGKTYFKSFGDVKFGEIDELKKEYQYWYKYEDSLSTGIVVFNSPETVFTTEKLYGKKTVGIWQATSGVQVFRWKSSYNPNDQGFHKNISFVPRGNYFMEQYGSSTFITDTNMPLNEWGDIFDGTGLDDFFSDVTEEGPGLTAEELSDLTDDLLQALLDNMPDLTTTEGILQAIYRKCCEISNKIGKSASNVYNVALQGIQSTLDKIASFCSEYWNKFSDFMQSLFVPQSGYIQDTLDDIQAEWDLKFAFADSLKNIITKCFDVYKAGGTKAPTVKFHITGLGFLNAIISHTIDLSDWDEYVKPIRSMVCVITYVTFAWNTYRRIPAYVSGVGEQ